MSDTSTTSAAIVTRRCHIAKRTLSRWGVPQTASATPYACRRRYGPRNRNRWTIYNAGRPCSALAFFNSASKSASDWLTTFVSLQTLIKFVSPSQRGHDVDVHVAGQTRPRTAAEIQTHVEAVRTDRNRQGPLGFPHELEQLQHLLFGRSRSRSAMCRAGAIRRWPLLYGNRFSTTRLRAVRHRTRFCASSCGCARSWQRKQPSSFARPRI